MTVELSWMGVVRSDEVNMSSSSIPASQPYTLTEKRSKVVYLTLRYLTYDMTNGEGRNSAALSGHLKRSITCL